MSLKTFQHEFWNSGSSPVSGAPCHSGTPLSKAASMPSPKSFSPAGPLRGSIAIPGDKSISHRSLMLSALAIGESVIEGLLEGEDVHATATALRAMGADIERGDDAVWRVNGVGVGGLLQPQTALDMGNSGTSTRLLMGLVASHAITVTFVGDVSLSKRPMARVSDPLSLMGASFTGTPGTAGAQCLPMMVRGACPAVPIAYRLPMASAQVKSAILLAGLNTPGITRVIEPMPTRDHSERMLKGFGADIEVDIGSCGVRTISIRANGKPNDLICLFGAGSEHDDVHIRFAAQTGEQFDSINAWEHRVEDDQIRLEGAGSFEPRVAICGSEDFVAFGFEVGAHQIDDGRFVVDHKDFCHRIILPLVDYRKRITRIMVFKTQKNYINLL